MGIVSQRDLDVPAVSKDRESPRVADSGVGHTDLRETDSGWRIGQGLGSPAGGGNENVKGSRDVDGDEAISDLEVLALHLVR